MTLPVPPGDPPKPSDENSAGQGEEHETAPHCFHTVRMERHVKIKEISLSHDISTA